MAWFPIANIVPQYIDPDTAKPFSGAVLKAYKVNTLTAIPFATDNTGSTTVNSVALNASGNPEVSGNVVIPHLDQDYKLALYPDQTAADSDSGALWTVDDIKRALGGIEAGDVPTNAEIGAFLPSASDSGADAFEADLGRDIGAEETVRADFGSANTTTTPTLENTGGAPSGAKTMTARDGSALWADALSGPHTLQLASDSGSWLVLDPNPSQQRDLARAATGTKRGDVKVLDEDDFSSDSPDHVPTQKSVNTHFKNQRELVALINDKHNVDTALDGVDGIDVRDIDGDGKLDILMCTGTWNNANPGNVFWYQQGADAKTWTKQTIEDGGTTTGLGDLQGCCLGNFADDGNIYAAVGSKDNDWIQLFTHGGDPTAAWTRTFIVGSRPNIQGVRAFDIDGDGKDEIVFAFEGDADGVGGIRWLDYTGGGLTDAANWNEHEIIQHNGAWRILDGGLRDVSGDGVANDLPFSARNSGRNPAPNIGIFYVTQPSNVTNLWSETKVGDTPSDPGNFSQGDFFGNGTGRDFAVGDFDRRDLFLFDASIGWAPGRVRIQFNEESGLSIFNSCWNVAAVPGSKNEGRESIMAVFANGTSSGIFIGDYLRGDYQWRLVYSTEYGHPIDDLILPVDLNGDGKKELAASDPGGKRIFWLSTVPGGVPASAGVRLGLTATETIGTGSATTIPWDSALWESLIGFWNSGSPKAINVPDGVAFMELTAGVRWANNSTGLRLVRIRKNNTTDIAQQTIVATSNSEITVHTGPVAVIPGDFFAVEVFQDSGGDLDIQPGQRTFFAARPLSV